MSHGDAAGPSRLWPDKLDRITELSDGAPVALATAVDEKPNKRLHQRSSRLAPGLAFLIHRGRLSKILSLVRQPTLVATGVFALSGAAFAAGTLLIARILPVEEFARFALAVALFNIFALVAPLGIDQQLLRRRIDPGAGLLTLLCGSGLVMGLLACMAAVEWGGLLPGEATPTVIAIAAGCVIATGGAIFRANHRPVPSLALATIASFLLLFAGLIGLFWTFDRASVPLYIFAGGNVVAAAAGWISIARSHRVPSPERKRIKWREAFSLLGIATLATVSLQLERLIVPVLLDLRDLAQFTVLASVAIFPFRLVTAGLGFALVPRLRAAPDLHTRRRLVRLEVIMISGVLIAASLALLLFAPAVTALVTDDHYTISRWLTFAACLNGSAKVLMALPRSILTACGTEQDIARLNRHGLLWIVLAVGGAAAGVSGGLAGLLIGASVGSVIATIPSIILAIKRLNHPEQNHD